MVTIGPIVAVRFIGGLRLYRRGTTTPRLVTPWAVDARRPFAELLMDDQRVLLRLRWAWSRRLFGVTRRIGTHAIFLLGTDSSWEAARDSVSAEAFDGFVTPGVLLRSPGLPPAIFWCSDQTRRAVLAGLQAERRSDLA